MRLRGENIEYDNLVQHAEETLRMRNAAYAERDAYAAAAKAMEAERDALASQNTALIKQMGASVERERQWGERVKTLEAALDDRRTPRAAEWKYLDDGVTLMKAALQAIPELYRDGDPNQLHYAIKEWLSRPERANGVPSAEQPPLLERTLQAGYDIQTRQRDEIRELRKALRKIAAYDPGTFRPLEDEVAIWRIATEAMGSQTEAPVRRDQFCSNEYSELGAPVSTLCAICDQIKELHPASHLWTAKSTAETEGERPEHATAQSVTQAQSLRSDANIPCSCGPGDCNKRILAHNEYCIEDCRALEVEEDLLLDRRVYGTSFHKIVKGKKVRVHPQDVRIINGVPKDSSNAACTSEKIKGDAGA